MTSFSRLRHAVPSDTSIASSIQWIDYAKGIGILLVVVGHVMRGLVSAEILPNSDWVQGADAWIYAFHMPLFFLISGLFIERSRRKPFRQFLADKIRRIAYPYFLWSILQGLLQLAAGRSANSANDRLSLSQLWQIVYLPQMQFWFLYVLFLLLISYVILRRLQIPTWGMLAGVVSLNLMPDIALGSWGVVYMMRNYAAYFLLGALLSASLIRWVDRLLPRSSVRIALIGYIGVGIGVTFGWTTSFLGGLGVASLGIVATLALAKWMNSGAQVSIVKGWGLRSLEIFVAHTIALALVRIVLSKVGVYSVILHGIIGTIAGLYGPLLLHTLIQRVGFPYLFIWPNRSPKAAPV